MLYYDADYCSQNDREIFNLLHNCPANVTNYMLIYIFECNYLYTLRNVCGIDTALQHNYT